MRARERKRESKREREKCLEAKKMKTQTLKRLKFFFFLIFSFRKGWVEFRYIFFWVKWGDSF